MLIELYNRYFRFPLLLFQVPAGVVGGATALTSMAAGLGAIGAVARAVRIPPAEAMRPEPPSGYRRGVLETPFVARRLGTAGRMVLRNVSRHPFRAAASILGIAFARGDPHDRLRVHAGDRAADASPSSPTPNGRM